MDIVLATGAFLVSRMAGFRAAELVLDLGLAATGVPVEVDVELEVAGVAGVAGAGEAAEAAAVGPEAEADACFFAEISLSVSISLDGGVDSNFRSATPLLLCPPGC